jgi:hypothetical protein
MWQQGRQVREVVIQIVKKKFKIGLRERRASGRTA